MLLQELVDVLETIKQRIRHHGSPLRENETRTRLALIDPLLTALGWDVSDPAMVTPEYSVGSGRADYALNGSESIPAAIVEAKRLGHSLNDDERMQMLNYANARGVRYAAVTDGDVWEVYPVFDQSPLEDRRLLDLHIANSPAHELALQFLLLWRPNLASGQPSPAEEPRLNAPAAVETEVPNPSQQTKESETPNGPKTPTQDPKWESLANFNPAGRNRPPGSMRFPDHHEDEIHHWYEILTMVAMWLHSTGKLTVTITPVPSSATHYIVNNQPIHPTGDEFARYREIASGQLAVNILGSAVKLTTDARKLLQHCGVNPDTITLQVS